MHICCLQKIAPQEQSAQDIPGAMIVSTTHEPAVDDDDDDYESVEADVDSDLLFSIPFKANIKPKAVRVAGGEGGLHQKSERLYRDRPNVSDWRRVRPHRYEHRCYSTMSRRQPIKSSNCVRTCAASWNIRCARPSSAVRRINRPPCRMFAKV